MVIQNVADEIKESKRLNVVSAHYKLDEGPFGPDPRRTPDAFSSKTLQDSVLAKLHQVACWTRRLHSALVCLRVVSKFCMNQISRRRESF
jgi:hypothetical protein